MSARQIARSFWNGFVVAFRCVGLFLGIVVSLTFGVHTAIGQQPSTTNEQDFPSRYLLRSLVAPSKATRSVAIARIEHEFTDDPQAVTTIKQALDRIEGNSRHRETAIELVRLMSQLDQAEVPSYLEGLLGSPDHRIAMLALDGLLRQRHVETFDSILDMADRPEFDSMHGFRIAVLEALTKLRHPKAMDLLIELLPNLRGESAALVVDFLSGFTQKNLGNDPGAWRTWWQSMDRSMFRYEAVTRVRIEGDSESESTSFSTDPYFFGVPIRAGRLVFVIDKSKSMSMLLSGEANSSSSQFGSEVSTTRIARAQHELVTAISALPDEAHFNIIVFNGEVVRWQRNLVAATAEKKTSAVRFVMNSVASGETASFDALEDAFSLDPNLETVYFLSDGVPTVGRIVPAPDIIHAVTTENFFRRITIHTIGLGVGRSPARFLRKLAERNRGEYQEIGSDTMAAKNAISLPHGTQRFLPRQVFTPPMPPILTPRVQPGHVATKRLKGNELVLGITLNGQSRAYPLNMLTGPNREIINDQIGDRPIAATWCHLAHCATVYDRRANDKTLTLTVSGLLWNETLVMMDTDSRSLWAQLTGKAMSGTSKGNQLTRIPSVVTEWTKWYQQHPKTTVTMLSRTATQFDRRTFSLLSDFVIGATMDGESRAWALDDLLHQPAVNDLLNNTAVLVTFDSQSTTANLFQRKVGGQILDFDYEGGKLIDEQTGSVWDLTQGQAIAGPFRGESLARFPFVVAYHETWSAFHPASSFFNE